MKSMKSMIFGNLWCRYWDAVSHKQRIHSYDIWSAGVVWLEFVLGTPHVFQLSPATQAALDIRLDLGGKRPGQRQLLYLLRGMMEMCIYPPQVHTW